MPKLDERTIVVIFGFVFFVIVVTTEVFIVTNTNRQMIQYCNQTGGHIVRIKVGEHTTTSKDKEGNETGVTRVEDWESAVQLPDGKIITMSELQQRGIVNPWASK